jgi:hypothetical protein
MVIPKGQVAGSMSEDDSEWMNALLRPSSTMSAGAIILGSWALFLTAVNMVSGAYSPGHKVLWIGFLTGGNHHTAEMSLVLDDAVFGALGVALLAAGIVGMGKAREDGFTGWFLGLSHSPIFTSLLSPSGGVTRLLASWMILAGATFYLAWSAMNTTWVDPGVYSVTIALVASGFGLHILQAAES